MKISEFITELKQVKDNCGDLKVCMVDHKLGMISELFGIGVDDTPIVAHIDISGIGDDIDENAVYLFPEYDQRQMEILDGHIR